MKVNWDDSAKLKENLGKKEQSIPSNNQPQPASRNDISLPRSDRVVSFLANQFKNQNRTVAKKPERIKKNKVKKFKISSHKKDKLKIDPERKMVKSKSKDVQEGSKKLSGKKRQKLSKMNTDKSKGAEKFSVGIGSRAISQYFRKQRGITDHFNG